MALRSISLAPGPGTCDAEAFNDLNHEYLVNLHNEYGNTFAMKMASVAPGTCPHTARASGSGTKAETGICAGTGDLQTVFFVRHPDDVRKVLTIDDDFAKTWGAEEQSTSEVDYVHNLIQPLLTDTLFNNQGEGGVEGHHKGRRILMPTFRANKAFIQGFCEQVERCLEDEWRLTVSKHPTRDGGWREIDMLHLSHTVIRRALIVVITGRAASFACTDDAALMAVFDEAMQYFVDRYASGAHDGTVTEEDAVIMRRMKQAGGDVVAHWLRVGDTQGEDKTMLAVLAKEGFTEDEMAAMLINTIIAGAEAPASALAETVQELAYGESKPIQQRLAETLEALDGEDRTIDPSEKVPLLRQTSLEGLRRFAPATFVSRIAVRDCELAGYAIPRGTIVGVCVTAVHRDPTVHPDPMRFDPSRSDTSQTGSAKGLNPMRLETEQCFMTFSGGPRGCPGKFCGIAMFDVALAGLLRRFEFAEPAYAGRGGHVRAAHEGSVKKFVEWQIGGIPLACRERPRFRSRL